MIDILYKFEDAEKNSLVLIVNITQRMVPRQLIMSELKSQHVTWGFKEHYLEWLYVARLQLHIARFYCEWREKKENGAK